MNDRHPEAVCCGFDIDHAVSERAGGGNAYFTAAHSLRLGVPSGCR